MDRALPQGNWPSVSGPLLSEAAYAPKKVCTVACTCHSLVAAATLRVATVDSCPPPLTLTQAFAVANWLAILLWDHKLLLWLVPLLPLMPSLVACQHVPLCGHRLQFCLALCLWHSRRQCPAACEHKGFYDNDLLSAQAFPWTLSAVS